MADQRVAERSFEAAQETEMCGRAPAANTILTTPWVWLCAVSLAIGVHCAGGGPLANAAESCPSSVLTYVFAFHGSETIIPAAAFDTTIVNPDGDTTRVAFDHVRRSLTLDAVGREWAGVRVREQFEVAGVAVGTPVAATLQLGLEGSVLNNCGGGGCGAYFIATLATPTDSLDMEASIPGPRDSALRLVNTTMSLPVTITAGTPLDVAFTMLYHTTNVAWGTARMRGEYALNGLPEGVTAVPCWAGSATATRRSTWGRLKAAYR